MLVGGLFSSGTVAQWQSVCLARVRSCSILSTKSTSKAERNMPRPVGQWEMLGWVNHVSFDRWSSFKLVSRASVHSAGKLDW